MVQSNSEFIGGLFSLSINLPIVPKMNRGSSKPCHSKTVAGTWSTETERESETGIKALIHY